MKIIIALIEIPIFHFKKLAAMSDVLCCWQELQTQIESHNAEIVQMSQQAVADVDHASSLRSVAGRFEHVCALADAWQHDLQVALVQCPDFHHTIDNLHDWLSHIDMKLSAIKPVDVLDSQSKLCKQHSELKVLYVSTLLVMIF